MAIQMTYGTYTFNPVPMMSLGREFKKTEDGRLLHTSYKIDLEGTLTPFPSGSGGLPVLMAMQSGLSTAFSQQGCTFAVLCNGQSVLCCQPRINGINFKGTSNNWVDSIGYSINMEYDDMPSGFETNIGSNSYNIDTASEEWNIDIAEDRPYYNWTVMGTPDNRPLSFKLSHNISARAHTYYTSCNTDIEPWQYARNFVSGLVGSSTSVFSISSLTAPQFFNYSRKQVEHRLNGEYSVQEEWLIWQTGNFSAPATEEFVIDVKQDSRSDICHVSIQGTIHGLENRQYTGLDITTANIVTPKFNNALTYWQQANSLIYARCQQSLNNLALTNIYGANIRTLNPLRFSRSIGQNIPGGLITYSVEYTNEATPCVPGALAEDINLTVDYPQDVYASIAIIGRTAGPILQLINTRTAFIYGATIDVIVPIISSCNASDWNLSSAGSPHSNVKGVLVQLEQNLAGQYSQMVKSSDKIVWKPKEGKYNRSVTWVCTPCQGSGTAVSVLY